MQYTEQNFNLPPLDGFSEKLVSDHLKLYSGYVKNANLLAGQTDPELRRRFAFEWNGMRLHEYYFEALGGGSALSAESPIGTHIETIKKMGMTRGIGWVLLLLLPKTGGLETVWVSDHEIGHLAGCPVILAMDVWEHAYVGDFGPAGRKDYIEVFFKNLKWSTIEERFKNARA